MQELFRSLEKFNLILKQQIAIFRDLVPVLDEEETLIARFSLRDFEAVVTRKDQVVQRAMQAEQRRTQELQRICRLIGYDSRRELPALTEFQVVFAKYVENVRTLLDADTYAGIDRLHAEFSIIARDFRETFANVAPRLYRNRRILSRLAANFSKSIAILESEGVGAQGYQADGRTASRSGRRDPVSFVRVRA